MTTTDTMSIPDIHSHCAHGKNAIEDALNPLKGAREATVDIPAKQ